MGDTPRKPSFLEQHFWKLLAAPLGFAMVCIGYAAHSMAHPAPSAAANSPAVLPSAPTKATSERHRTPNASTEPMDDRELVAQGNNEAVVDPQKIEKPVAVAPPTAARTGIEDRELGFAKNDPPQIVMPFTPAGRVAPDPTDAPYVVPPNKPYLGPNDPKPAPAAPAEQPKPTPNIPKRAASPAAPAPAPAPKDGRTAVAKTFILKDGRTIQAASVTDQGDSYSVEDASGQSIEFSKSEVHLIVSRR